MTRTVTTTTTMRRTGAEIGRGRAMTRTTGGRPDENRMTKTRQGEEVVHDDEPNEEEDAMMNLTRRRTRQRT
jgi:hypothetical protein